MKAESWHELLGEEEEERPQLEVMTGQGPGDRDIIQGG